MSNTHAIEHGESRAGLWLRTRRVRVTLWVAGLETLIVLFSNAITKWTVIVLAIISVIAWFAARDSRSSVLRSALWILAASQLLTLIAVSLGTIVKWALILAVILFAVGGLIYLFRDRR